jgi:hypothetical protein
LILLFEKPKKWVFLAIFVLSMMPIPALIVWANDPPFVNPVIIPSVGFVGETFSIYVTAGDSDGYLTEGKVTLNGEDVSSEFHSINSTTWLYNYVSTSAGNYTAVFVATDNKGAVTNVSTTFKVRELTYAIRPVILSDDLRKLTGWEDMDFWANLEGSDGKRYNVEIYMTVNNIAKIKLDNAPPLIYFDGKKNIEENPFIRGGFKGPIITQRFPYSVVHTLRQGGVEFRFTCIPPDLHIVRVSAGADYIELNFFTRGLPFWGNEGKPWFSAFTGKAMIYEILCDVEGELVIGHKSIQLKGYGNFEHFWADKWDWRHTKHSDGVWFNFDELYGILFDVDDFTDGGVYLIKEKEYLVVDSYSVEYVDLAYNPMMNIDVPTKIHVIANTSKGVLEFVGQAQGFQNVSGKEGYYNIADMNLSGIFTYVNGTRLTLTNGSGWDQIISNDT